MVWQGALQYAKKDSSLDPNLISSQIEVLQNELKLLRQPQIQAMIIRFKANTYEFSDKPSKFMFNLEKRNYINKSISRIQENDQLITNQTDKFNKTKSFYENLYTSKIKNIETEKLQSFLNPKNIKNITLQDKTNLL